MSIVKQQTTYLSHWPSLTSEINSVNGCGDVPVRRYPPMLYPLLRLSLLYQLLPLSKRDAVTVVFDTTDGECLEDLLLVPTSSQLMCYQHCHPHSRAESRVAVIPTVSDTIAFCDANPAPAVPFRYGSAIARPSRYRVLTQPMRRRHVKRLQRHRSAFIECNTAADRSCQC